MEDSELFSNIDIMIEKNLKIKSIQEMQDELVAEIAIDRGTYKDNYNPALIFGEKGQAIFRKFLENEGYIFMSECKDITSDQTYLKDGKIWVFELKTDSRHKFIDDGVLKDTGNILFEYSCRGKDSGYKATKAEVFVTYFPQLNEFWLIKTQKLKRLIEEKKYEFIDKKNIGDKDSNTHGFLTKREKIRTEFAVKNAFKEQNIIA